MDKNETISVGWIDGGLIHSGFAANLSAIILNYPDKIKNVCVASGPYLSFNRNRMVSLFLETDTDWLLSLDSDVCLSLEAFEQLMNSADSETRPIVGGKYYIPFDDGRMVVASAQEVVDKTNHLASGQWLSPEKANSKEVVDGLHSVGIGLCLIHKDVFRAIATLTEDRFQWFQDEWREGISTWSSDDMHFWEKCRALGLNIAINTAVTSEHIKTFRLNDSVFLAANPDRSKHEPHSHYARPEQRTSWWARKKKNR